MKLILILPYIDYDLYKKYDYIILKKNKTIIKNINLLKNKIFFNNMINNGARAFIEKWEKFNGHRAHIVCGKHGSQLRPVHVVSNTDDQKALFQTEYNVVLRFNFDNNFLQIYENEIQKRRIVGKILQSLSFDEFFNGNNSTDYFDDIIRNVMSKINEEGFEYKDPFYAEGY